MTWLLDRVEVKGIVRRGTATDGTDVFQAAVDEPSGDKDWFDVLPDPNYSHLVSYFPGSAGFIHCETYPLSPDLINRSEPWPLPQKDEVPFLVFDKAESAHLLVGDHVRLIGRWVIENGHPTNQRSRGWLGWLRIGDVFPELHPFEWSSISRVSDPSLYDVVEEQVSVAAPLCETVYVGLWFANYAAGLANWPHVKPSQQRIYLTEDGSNLHGTVSATAHIEAPVVPSGLNLARHLSVQEEVTRIGPGLQLSDVRVLTTLDDGIRVDATVTSPTRSLREGYLPNVNDPAEGRSIFQATYRLAWQLYGSRITCINKRPRDDPTKRIQAIGGLDPASGLWSLSLDDAIAAVERGHQFYVESPPGDRVAVMVAVSRWGHKYLKTANDGDEPNNLLSLPECPVLT